MEQKEQKNRPEEEASVREAMESGELLLALQYQYAQNRNRDNLVMLLSCLRDSSVWMPVVKVPGKEDRPDLLQSSDGKSWIPVFSRQEQMPESCRKRFSVVSVPVTDAIRLAHRTREACGLVLDAFSPITTALPLDLADVILRLPSRQDREEKKK